jgi:hypothetical protein
MESNSIGCNPGMTPLYLGSMCNFVCGKRYYIFSATHSNSLPTVGVTFLKNDTVVISEVYNKTSSARKIGSWGGRGFCQH